MESIEPKRRHHRKKKGSTSGSSLISKALAAIGIVFTLAGFVYAITLFKNSDSLIQLFLNLFQPQELVEVEQEMPGGTFNGFLFFFLPSVVGLAIFGYFKNLLKQWNKPISVFLASAVMFLQIILALKMFLQGEWYFPNLAISILFIVLIVIVHFWNAWRLKSVSVLLIAIGYFYFSLLTLSVFYLRSFEYYFSVAIIFSVVHYMVSKAIAKPSLNLLNQAFAIGFIGLFWLRKFVVNTKPDFLLVFLVFATAFYILFYVITLLASRKDQPGLSKWSQVGMLWGNFLFFAATTGFVIIKFYGFGYLWILVSALILLHSGGTWWMKQTESTAWKLPHTFINVVLASLLLPLLLQQNMVLIFVSGLSVGMLYVTLIDKNKTTYWAYLASAGLMLLLLAYNWFVVYLPALIFPIEVPQSELMVHGIVSTLAVMLALLMQLVMIKDDTLPSVRQAPDTIKLRRILRVLILGALFGFLTWVSSIIVIRLENSTIWVPVAWFIAGALFFIGFFIGNAGKKNFLKKPILYTAFVFLMLYPLLVQWRMFAVNAMQVHMGQYHVAGIVLHYIALAVMVILMLLVIPKIMYQVRREAATKAFLQLLSIVIIILVIGFEYENLYIIVSGSRTLPMLSVAGQDIPVSGNHYLAFSVLAGLLMIAVLVKSLLDNDIPLRNISFVVSGLILLKIFFYDFSVISTGMRAVVFIATGIILLSIAILYPRLQKEGKQRYERRHKKKKIEA